VKPTPAANRARSPACPGNSSSAVRSHRLRASRLVGNAAAHRPPPPMGQPCDDVHGQISRNGLGLKQLFQNQQAQG
jgi:hypothetical protein